MPSGRLSKEPVKTSTKPPPLYYFHANPAQTYSQIAGRGAPSPPRNSHDHESLTNWRNASTWYSTRAMAVESKNHVYMQVPRRLRRPRRGYTQQQLNDWLDEQERIIRARALPDELVAEFDPLYNLQLQQQLHQVYDRGERAMEQGRRTILFRFRLNLETSIANEIQNKLVEHVKTRFKLKHRRW